MLISEPAIVFSGVRCPCLLGPVLVPTLDVGFQYDHSHSNCVNCESEMDGFLKGEPCFGVLFPKQKHYVPIHSRLLECTLLGVGIGHMPAVSAAAEADFHSWFSGTVGGSEDRGISSSITQVFSPRSLSVHVRCLSSPFSLDFHLISPFMVAQAFLFAPPS